jgi:hypothetical protein
MHKPFGAQGEILNFPFKELHETFYNQDGIEVEIHEGILFVGVDDNADLERAKEVARLFLAAWSERQQIKTQVAFNHTWQTHTEGITSHSIEPGDSGKPGAPLHRQTTTHQVVIPCMCSLVTHQMQESTSFTNDMAILQKAQKYPALKHALFYYNEEVLEADRPLYGIYKALEAMVSHFQVADKLNEHEAKKKLADLIGQGVSYVSDTMQTTQVTRHYRTQGRRKISDEESLHRTKVLIDAFARSLP